jgi:3,4-dihydroxy 2-butanone 4-phosphate synthase / GTP cyclohydrolase II
MMAFATIDEALVELREGRMIVVVDDEDRENEGDLVLAAEQASSDAINFMATHGRGLICVALPGDRLDALRIPMMSVEANDTRYHTAFTVSVDVGRGTTTGISAQDRALTIRALADPVLQPEDLIKPGHIFPLRAREGGVLQRRGHTEAAVDLPRLAGLYPAGAICEILNEDGSMARLPQLQRYADHHGLKIISIEDLVAYRRQRERHVTRLVQTRMPTRHGVFTSIVYEDPEGDGHPIALTMGDVSGGGPVLVRVQSECLTGEVFGSLRCDCGPQLEAAMAHIAAEGRGVILYLRQEGRGIGLANKLRAYALQDQGLDTVEANKCLGFPPDLRDFGVATRMLQDLGVREVRLLTNNPAKLAGIENGSIHVVARVPLVVAPNPKNGAYLRTKRDKMQHMLDVG